MNPSKELNLLFGDKTGRSISRRTAHGFKNVTGLKITSRESEVIMHGAMLASAAGLSSKNPTVRTLGGIGATALFLLYHAGK